MLPSLTRGDVVRVHWVDIMTDPVGNPAEAQFIIRRSLGHYWDVREVPVRGPKGYVGVPAFLTTSTLDIEELQTQQGYDIFPLACVLEVEVVQRAKLPRKPRGPRRKESRNAPQSSRLDVSGPGVDSLHGA